MLTEFLELVNKVDNKEIKDALVEKFKVHNQEKGKALSDLNEYKAQYDILKGENSNLKKSKSTYEEIANELAKAGIDASNADKLLQKLNVQKTAEDEVNILKKTLNDLTEKTKKYEAQERLNQIKSVLDVKLGDAKKEFKDKDGKTYPILDRFIPKDKLYEPIDTNVEALVSDRITKALQIAYNEQEKFKQETGMDIVKPVHNVDTGNTGHFSKTDGINTNTNSILAEFASSQRNIDSATIALAKLAAQKQLEK